MNAHALCPERTRPLYAHRPGQTPHPRSHPNGHSRGTPEPEPEPITADKWRENSDYLFGFDLYNEGYFWEAHEAWEHLWRGAGDHSAQRDFLQGLIQVAGCALKTAIDNQEGAAALAARAVDHLERAAQDVGSQYMGVDILRITSMLRATGTAPMVLLPE